MAELCSTHKLALAADGKCVLCRRPKHAIMLEAAEETAAGRALTILLGLGLLAGIAALGYTWSLPQPTARASRPTLPALRPELARTAPIALSDAGLEAESDDERIEPDSVEQEPLLSSEALVPGPEPVPRTRAPRTVGARIVDPKLADARREVKVVMYSAPWCFICDRARSFLQAREVDIEEHDIDRSAAAEKQLAQINQAGSIPTFVVEQKTIVGFHPWGLEDAIDAAAREHYCAGDLEGAVCERPRPRR